MDQQLYQKYLEELTLEALAKANHNVPLADFFLEKKHNPRFYKKQHQKKNAALERVRKVFNSSRERSLYVVLKSLGLDDLAKEKL